MKGSIDNLMREFNYDDKRIGHLLGMFGDQVRFIKDYDDQFDLGSKEHERLMLAGYRNSAFDILLSLLQLGHITMEDFHHRMHALNIVFYERMGTA
ncbi:hypothetical protein GALL_26600 [mine drainage metagenome]|uniref:Uncharacterized protein n=1 Tax=mine drainage metagenome TaxID=410659 RepID=A0A1J5TKY0_9ZZZZ